MDKAKAVRAAAHKPARLIHGMRTKDENYSGQRRDYHEERDRERVLRQLAQRAEKMGVKQATSENAS